MDSCNGCRRARQGGSPSSVPSTRAAADRCGDCRRRPACRGRPPTGWRSRSRRTGCCAATATAASASASTWSRSGRAADGRVPARRARPAAARRRCATTTGESVQLYVREGDARRCVVSLQSPHGLRWIVPRGCAAAARPRLGRAGAVGRAQRRGWSRASRSASRASRRSAPRARGRRTIVAAVSVLPGPVERITRQPGRRSARSSSTLPPTWRS